MSHPSILFLNRVSPPAIGATGWRLSELAQSFAKAGWRVTVVTGGTEGGESGMPGVTVVRAGGGTAWGAFDYIGAWAALVRTALRQPRHDLVVTMTDPPFLALAGPVLAAAWGCRLIHWSQDLYPDLLPVIGRPLPRAVHALLARAMGAALRRHDAVVAIGPCMAARLAATGLWPDRLNIIPNWPDQAIADDGPGAAVLRRELGLEGRFVVLYAGNFGLAHPLDAVFDAARHLARRLPSVHFLLVGEGRRRPALEAAAQRHALTNLTLLPRQPQERLAAVLGAADLHLAAMAVEAAGMLIPNKIAAAFAAGRPCILLGPEECGPAADIRAAGAGTVVPPGDGAALGSAIAEFAENAAVWQAACRAARDLAAACDRAAATGRFVDLAERVRCEAAAPTASGSLQSRRVG